MKTEKPNKPVGCLKGGHGFPILFKACQPLSSKTYFLRVLFMKKIDPGEGGSAVYSFFIPPLTNIYKMEVLGKKKFKFGKSNYLFSMHEINDVYEIVHGYHMSSILMSCSLYFEEKKKEKKGAMVI